MGNMAPGVSQARSWGQEDAERRARRTRSSSVATAATAVEMRHGRIAVPLRPCRCQVVAKSAEVRRFEEYKRKTLFYMSPIITEFRVRYVLLLRHLPIVEQIAQHAFIPFGFHNGSGMMTRPKD